VVKEMAKVSKTRERLMDIAEDAILQKGFGATSIDEIIAAAEITKSGFFYHFRDKNELALALIERFIDQDNQVFDKVFNRAKELHDDPLHQFLIGLKLFAELTADLPNGHPGCLIATFCYHERQYDKRVTTLNRQVALDWRRRFREMLDEITAVYPPKKPINLDALADMVLNTVEGGIIMSKTLRDPSVLPDQVMLMRSYIQLLFTAKNN